MRQKSGKSGKTAEQVVSDIRRKTPKRHPSDEKIRIVLEGLHGEVSILQNDPVSWEFAEDAARLPMFVEVTHPSKVRVIPVPLHRIAGVAKRLEVRLIV